MKRRNLLSLLTLLPFGPRAALPATPRQAEAVPDDPGERFMLQKELERGPFLASAGIGELPAAPGTIKQVVIEHDGVRRVYNVSAEIAVDPPSEWDLVRAERAAERLRFDAAILQYNLRPSA